MKKLVYYIGILICTSIFFFSCIKEDLSNCPQGMGDIVPQLVLIPYDGNNITNKDLQSADVYVFDEADTLVATYSIGVNPELNKIYVPGWELSPGKYTYIAWANHHNASFRIDPYTLRQTKQTQTFLEFLVPETRIVDNASKIPLLCFGHLINDSLTAANQLIKIPIMQLTNTINLTVSGLSLSLGNDFTFSINDNNGIYEFNGSFASDDFFTYSTTNQAISDVFNASLTVLKLSKDRNNPTLVIKNNSTGETFSSGLIQLILAAIPDNDFDKTHVYNITISNPFSTETEPPFTITINGWIVDLSNVNLNIN